MNDKQLNKIINRLEKLQYGGSRSGIFSLLQTLDRLANAAPELEEILYIMERAYEGEEEPRIAARTALELLQAA